MAAETKKDRIDRIETYAASAFKTIKNQQLAPHPANFTLFYEHASAHRNDLVRAVEEAMASQGGLNEDKARALFNRFFGSEQESAFLREESDRLGRTLVEVLETLKSSGDDTERYGEILNSLTGAAAESATMADMNLTVHMLLKETKEFLQKTKMMEDKLHASSQEVEQLRQNLEEVRTEALTDALTGLANRRRFEEVLGKELAGVQNDGGDCCLLIIDVDHFKRFNDTFGHRMGDEVLKLLGKLLQQHFKGKDTPARFGGEEFVVVLSNTRIGQAKKLAEEVRAKLQGKKLTNRLTGESLGNVTITIGIARCRREDTLESLLERADGCLYKGKEAGRNRVITESDVAKVSLAS